MAGGKTLVAPTNERERERDRMSETAVPGRSTTGNQDRKSKPEEREESKRVRGRERGDEPRWLRYGE